MYILFDGIKKLIIIFHDKCLGLCVTSETYLVKQLRHYCSKVWGQYIYFFDLLLFTKDTLIFTLNNCLRYPVSTKILSGVTLFSIDNTKKCFLRSKAAY